MNQILEILQSLGFNWHVAVVNFVNFLVILFVLNKFFFKKLGKVIQSRHDTIERGLHQAKEAESALSGANEEKKKIIHEARVESTEIVKQAHNQALSVVETMIQDADKDLNARKDALTLEEKQLKNKVEEDFRAQAPELVAMLTKKVLLKEMNEKANNEFISKLKTA